MTRITNMDHPSADDLPLPGASRRPAVTGRQRARGVALIVLGSFIALTLLAGLVDLAPAAPLVMGLFILGVIAGLVFIAGGVQLLRQGKFSGVLKSAAALVVTLLLAALWSARTQLV